VVTVAATERPDMLANTKPTAERNGITEPKRGRCATRAETEGTTPVRTPVATFASMRVPAIRRHDPRVNRAERLKDA
jgi:hypothetical protein